MPELDGRATDEAERRYRRAELEARKMVEDRAGFVTMTIWACCGGVGGAIGGIHGAFGAAAGAALGALVGSVAGSVYKSRLLKAATREVLRRQDG